MNIVHLPVNIANLASRLAQGQRRLGHRATVLSRPTPPYDFPCDVPLPDWKDPVRRNLVLWKHLKLLQEADIIHIHGGMWRTDVFYALLRKLTGARLVVHYHGFEARMGLGLFWRKLVNAQMYTPADLKRFVPSGTWIPQPIDLPPLPPPPNNPRAVFVHFTTTETNKGTAQVVETFKSAFQARPVPTGRDSLVWAGKDAELRVYSGVPFSRVPELMAQADVVFDQIAPYGIYGYVAVEGMALGKPVLATINRSLYPADCPVLSPRKTKLMELAKRSNHYGELGRAYIARVHESLVVAEKSITAYEKALYTEPA